MDENFVKAQSNNLPAVDTAMLMDFLVKWFEKTPESKGTKQLMSSQGVYGDKAIGYVQLKRENGKCILRARVCPEHRVTKTPYKVEVVINEDKKFIESAKCFSCAAAKGGCKHALAFVIWCERKGEEPSSTSVTSYWNKPKLSLAISSKEPIKCKDFAKEITPLEPTFDVLSKVLNSNRQNNINSVLYETLVVEPLDKMERLSVGYMTIKYLKSLQSQSEVTFNNFLEFVKVTMAKNEVLCEAVYSKTKLQNEEPLWFSMRYGRITASTFKEATACTTDGSLANRITGSYNNFCSQLMKRGKVLEPLVLKAVEKKLNAKFVTCGLKLNAKYPLFGASADGISLDSSALIEIKCPSSDATIGSYVKNGVPRDGVKLQMQLQMLMHNIPKCMLCIASPKFEINGEVQIILEHFDEALTANALSQAMDFYEKIIFPKLLITYK